MGQTLQPGNQISHYKIIGPLGSGGMGEVYLAHDLTLERNVAIKVLPSELVRNEERVRRFILEAKSASSLSHPNIVTIHEIGRDRVRTGEPEDPANDTTEPVHFIAMELVSGETLKDKIHHEKTDLRTLLGYLAQAAEGLAKAHSSGIVHRDLKPGNIMVTKDGFTKVLDFGLAKLTERRTAGADMTSAPTEMGDLTGGGVVGTAGYMSPEQIRGKAVDHRSDIFSFGCILHEATARQRPFSADTDVETMTKILNEKPPALEDLNPAAPAELRRLIRRCLAKNPDQRSQSIKDIAIELREIIDEYDTLSASATSGSSVASSVSTAAAAPAPRTGMMVGIAAAILIGVGGLAVGFYGLRGRASAPSAPVEPFQSMKMTNLISDSSIETAVLSPDGRYLAYVAGSDGQWSVTVRQVVTGSNVVVIAPQKTPIRGMSFSPDSNYLYYLGRDPETPNYSSLFEMPSLGGSSRKRAFDVDTAVAFSPDAKRVCFIRGLTQKQETHIVILELATGKETVLAVIKPPSMLPQLRPSWSHDGSRIAVELIETTGGIRPQVAVFEVNDGSRRSVGDSDWLNLSDAEWVGGDALVVAGGGFQNSGAQQILRLSWPEGRAARVTNDLDNYFDLSVSADGQIVAALRNSIVSDIWIAPVSGTGAPRKLPRASGGEQAVTLLEPAKDGSIVYLARTSDGSAIKAVAADGSAPRQITPEDVLVAEFQLIPDGRGVVFSALRGDKVPHLWRVDLDGGNFTQLTQGTGEMMITNSHVSSDGKWVLYRPTEAPGEVWKCPVAGGEPVMIENIRNAAFFSPDGRLIAGFSSKEIGGRDVTVWSILPINGGEPIAEFVPPPRAFGPWWAPDGAGIDYVEDADRIMSIMRWSFADDRTRSLLRFPEARINAIAWSPDGKEILFQTTKDQAQNLHRFNIATGKVAPLTDFRTGKIFDFRWAVDGASVTIAQGDVSREVVLIRGFK